MIMTALRPAEVHVLKWSTVLRTVVSLPTVSNDHIKMRVYQKDIKGFVETDFINHIHCFLGCCK